jgi:hypothetical protein
MEPADGRFGPTLRSAPHAGAFGTFGLYLVGTDGDRTAIVGGGLDYGYYQDGSPRGASARGRLFAHGGRASAV